MEPGFLDPPGEPIIQGPSLGEIIQRNETVTLECRSRGGNPLAQLWWYRGNEKLTSQWHHYADQAINTYSFVAQPSDNNAVFRCEASNLVTQHKKTASLRIPVYCKY